MSAPEKIEVNRHNGWRDGYKTIVNDDDFGDIVFEDTHYIRQDIHEATLAERDKEIAELRAALNEAAQGYENLVAIGVLPIAYEEAVQELSNKYRAIAKDTK